MNPTSNDLPQLELMRQGVDYNFRVAIRAFQVKLRPVTIGEHQQINQEIIDKLSQMPQEMRHSLNESYLLAKEMLKAACKLDPEGKTAGPLTDYILDKMTIDEVLLLYKQYEDGVEKVNPRLEDLSAEDVNALVELVKKNPTELTGLSFVQLASMVRLLLKGD